MPARHTSLQDDLLSRSDLNRMALVDERGCRRDIRSNGWIVFRKSSLFQEPVRQKKQVFFVRCGSLELRNFTGPKARSKSGPDVFADALVPTLPRDLAPAL